MVTSIPLLVVCPSFFWYGTDFLFACLFMSWVVLCHTKQRMGTCDHTHPSFGIMQILLLVWHQLFIFMFINVLVVSHPSFWYDIDFLFLCLFISWVIRCYTKIRLGTRGHIHTSFGKVSILLLVRHRLFIFMYIFYFLWKSVSHQKKDGHGITRPFRPSFGMTKAIRDLST